MRTTNDIRRAFLGYFEKNDHRVMPSSPLVPQQDPTLMFTNSGMVQFKHVFTGAEQPKAPRATTSQKCVRAGGKHNDLDNVGYTARHHTFFEMLGNFSFGDYFKEQAITHAWELLTKDFALPKEKLLVTVYHTDDEAANLWKKIAGLTDERIIRIATKDNFWQMGDTGPCGPCSEIFYDHGDKIPGGPPGSPDEDGDRFIEIWNLVFMQFNQSGDGEQTPLPKPSIDTGMGLERVAAVMQGVHDNYDIDLFKNLIHASEELTATKAEGKLQASHRVIADHLRSSAFLMADGVLPSNEGRGYVVRRIMRRAMRHAHLLGAKEPLMHRLVPTLVNEMGEAYPELLRAQALISENLRLEEERFKVTLERGLSLLEDSINLMDFSGSAAALNDQSTKKTLPGDIAFKLYDTFGFPLDLTQDVLRGRGMTVDTAGFDASMAEQKARARAAWSGSGDKAQSTLWLELKDKLGATEFLGYTDEKTVGKIVALVQDDQEVDRLGAGETGWVVTNQTPFYGESGGQVGDVGVMRNPNAVVLGDSEGSRTTGRDPSATPQEDGLVAEVLDTKKVADGLVIHKVTTKAPIAVGDELELVIDNDRRDRLRANHSGTHLLNAALRHVLGDHVTQKGSEVSAERLRFDISHAKPLTDDEIVRIEAEVNEQIWKNTPATTKLMATDDAIKAGAVAMFGEKYGSEVRVLAMGTENDEGIAYSVELCGGTHVRRTGDIGLFRITGDSALAAGVRRIEAVTRDGAYAYFAQRDDQLQGIARDIKTPVAELNERVATLQQDKRRLEKELAEAKKRLALGGSSGDASYEKADIGNATFAWRSLEGIDAKDLRGIATETLQQSGADVVALASNVEGKAAIVIAVAPQSTGQFNSAELIRIATPAVGGQGGGGRPEFAQGGGPNGGDIGKALETVKEELARRTR